MKIDTEKAFNLMLLYLEKESIYLGEKSRVDSYLSGSDLNDCTHATSLTVEPFYWFDWVELVESSVKNDPSIVNNTNGVSPRDCIQAIWYFVKLKCLDRNENMLLKDAHLMLVYEYYACKNNFIDSGLWAEWQMAIAIADGTFEEKYP